MHVRCRTDGPFRIRRVGHLPLVLLCLAFFHAGAVLAADDDATIGQPPPSASVRSNPSIQVQLRGRNIADDWVTLVRELTDSGISVPKKTVTPDKGSGLCQIYIAAEGLPGCSESLLALAKALNPDAGDLLSANKPVVVPDLSLRPSEWSIVLDRSSAVDAPRLDDFEHRWGSSILSKDQRGDLVRLKMRSYDVLVPASDTSVSAGAHLAKPFSPAFDKSASQTQPVVKRITISPDNAITERAFGVSPHDHYLACSRAGYTGHDPVPYSILLNTLEMPACTKTCVGPCPQINLLDNGVYLHPDFGSAIVQGGIKDSSASTPSQAECDTIAYGEQNHATMLAAIMVSQDTPKSQFLGLARSAQLRSWNRNDLISERQWANRLHDLAEDAWDVPQLFVFAGQFVTHAHQRYKDVEERKSDPIEVDTILRNKLLWITAAGQPSDDDPNVRQISPILPDSPMNLGDQQSVIVVTSCTDCNTENARVWPGAFFSDANDGLVNLAAPGGSEGKDIPGPADGYHYSEAHGTSQATAFVGGVAAAMLTCFPDKYRSDGRWLKSRLQNTATPMPNPLDSGKVTGGIVNIRRALLDPSADWIDRGHGLEQLRGTHWCKPTYAMDDGEDPLPEISARHIGAILRTRDSDTGSPRWQVANSDLDTAKTRWTSAAKWSDDSPVIAGIVDGNGGQEIAIRGQDIYQFVPNAKFDRIPVKACSP